RDGRRPQPPAAPRQRRGVRRRPRARPQQQPGRRLGRDALGSLRSHGVSTVKCLVWDLDNTLWKGVLLEDGEVHLRDEIRRVVVGLDERGLLQAVASHNDYDHAWAWLEKLGIAEYIVLPEIGWGPKSASVKAIAEKLQFALHTVA